MGCPTFWASGSFENYPTPQQLNKDGAAKQAHHRYERPIVTQNESSFKRATSCQSHPNFLDLGLKVLQLVQQMVANLQCNSQNKRSKNTKGNRKTRLPTFRTAPGLGIRRVASWDQTCVLSPIQHQNCASSPSLTLLRSLATTGNMVSGLTAGMPVPCKESQLSVVRVVAPNHSESKEHGITVKPSYMGRELSL